MSNCGRIVMFPSYNLVHLSFRFRVCLCHPNHRSMASFHPFRLLHDLDFECQLNLNMIRIDKIESFFFAFFSFDHKPSFSQPINQYISYRIWIETSCNSTSWFADGSNIVIIPQIELWLNSSYIDIGYSYRNWLQCSSSTSSNSYSLSFMIQPQHWLDSDRWLAGLNWAVWCEPLYKFNRAFNKKEEKTICLKIFA